LDEIRQGGSSITLSCRQLVRLMLEHMHPEAESTFIDSDQFTQMPTFCMWRMKQGVLLRGFHLHPVMIDFSDSSSIRNLENLRYVTTDSTFIGQAISRWSEIYVETDSDNFFMGSLHPTSTPRIKPGLRLSRQETVRGMAYDRRMNPLNRSFFMTAIRMHAE